MIEKDSNITQRAMSEFLGVAVSMINTYLDKYEKNGYLTREYLSSKTVQYNITQSGTQRKKILNLSYLNASQKIFNSAKSNIEEFLKTLVERGFKDLLLYGAGEVAEILLTAITTNENPVVSIIAVVDDDVLKQGEELVSKSIISANEIENYRHDGILISSYTNHNEILCNLKKMNYDENKILRFFD
jgi:FlaA1/EpsC-like NDP-sugar epimerase